MQQRLCNLFVDNIEKKKMDKHNLKISWCKHCKIFNVFLTIFPMLSMKEINIKSYDIHRTLRKAA